MSEIFRILEALCLAYFLAMCSFEKGIGIGHITNQGQATIEHIILQIWGLKCAKH